jgi:diguanylate cyclase (GGDEF)-like protein
VASSGSAAQKRSHTGLFFDRLDWIPDQIWAGLVALALISLALWAAWGRDRRRLSGNAFVDPVTGIANAAALNRTLDRELDRARRFKRPLGLLVLEIREPEHEDGKLLRARDTTMRQASDAISERIREADTVARLDDDRFAVISPEATAISAATLARALERRLEELRIHARVGIAEREATDTSARDLLARAEPASGTEPAPRSKESKLRVLRAA